MATEFAVQCLDGEVLRVSSIATRAEETPKRQGVKIGPGTSNFF